MKGWRIEDLKDSIFNVTWRGPIAKKDDVIRAVCANVILVWPMIRICDIFFEKGCIKTANHKI
jgi:hypothetical protein